MRVFLLCALAFLCLSRLNGVEGKSRKNNHYKPTAADDVPPAPEPKQTKSSATQSASSASKKVDHFIRF